MFSFRSSFRRRVLAVFFMVGSFLATVVIVFFIPPYFFNRTPYFFHKNVKDFGIIGSLPNFFFGLGLSFFPLLLGRSFPFKQFKSFCVAVVCGAVAAELTRWIFDGKVFDPLDILASAAGAALAFLFCKRYVFSKEEIL
jgi:hypothetical protein